MEIIKIVETKRLAIVTKHKKEKLFVPLPEKEAGVRCSSPENLDTDTTGSYRKSITQRKKPICITTDALAKIVHI